MIFKDNMIINLETLKLCFIFVYTFYTMMKISNKNCTKFHSFVILIFLCLASIICEVVKVLLGSFNGMIFLISFLTLIFCVETSNKNVGNAILTSTIAITINYILFFIAVMLGYIPNLIFTIKSDFVNFIVIFLIYTMMIIFFCNIKKFKYGFDFLKKNLNNEYMDVILLNISVTILFASILFSGSDIKLASSLFLGLVILYIIMFITIQKSLQLYYKQKMLVKELDETKEDLARAENKIKILEKENIEESKKRHTVIHKQKSLEYKIEEMLTKTEISTEEAAEVRERLEKLNKEIYTEKEVMELDKTGISSIDDMLKYMQSECIKNKIDFTLQIKGNIHYMVHNLVKEEELETLLADHIKDAIIAINHTDNANRSILVRLGNIDDIYSLYIYDSGVEFKPEVLENLGKKPCTTYASEGGTGMGFMNTFDTLRKHKASLIIEEIGKPTEDNYTKAIIIKFDKKNEFKVKSYHEIEKV